MSDQIQRMEEKHKCLKKDNESYLALISELKNKLADQTQILEESQKLQHEQYILYE